MTLLHQHASGVAHARGIPVPLDGTPNVVALGDWIERTAEAHGVRCLCIDGPLGWQDPVRAHPEGALHARVSERRLNAPGKTGPPGVVKPRPYLPFIAFSIALFERLTARGWRLPDGSHSSARDPSAPERLISETFPTAAWRALGLPALPGKARARTDATIVPNAIATLEQTLGVQLHGIATHDEIQAVIGGLAGLWWEHGAGDRVQFVGLPPSRLDGTWREGYIMVPASPCR